MTLFDLDQIKENVKQLELEMMEDGFWDDHKKSAQHVQDINHKRKLLESYEALKDQLDSCAESVELLKMESDLEFQEEFSTVVVDLKK